MTGITRRMATPPVYDFARTVRALPMGHNDPCFRIADGTFWWTTRTPDGPATLSLRRDGSEVEATAWGAGRDWILARADGVAGLRDDLTGFNELAEAHPVVARVAKVYSGHRIAATGRVFQRLLRAVFEQRVSGVQAYRSYAAMVRYFHRLGDKEPAPGPLTTLMLPPTAEVIAASPYWVFHPLGVEQKRADTLCRLAAIAEQLEACPTPASLTQRMTALRGVGPWTAAEASRAAFGDPDAVSIGDLHIPHMVAWALAGQVRAGARDAGPDARKGDISPADHRMLELLEPFHGHRGRVCILLEMAGLRAPRFAPRQKIRTFARY
jgi:3-methyladenine DNA glycosylase/8-oxoguanine DNA glycosylase